MQKRPKTYDKKCEFCGDVFQRIRKHAQYCSVNCRFKAWDKRHPRLTSKKIGA